MTSENLFQPSEFFVLRTPLLAFDRLVEWADRADKSAVTESADAYLVCRRRLLDGLAELVRSEAVSEAIFIASPTVHESLTKSLESGDIGDHLAATLVKYIQRIAARPTPFGLFAGISVGRMGDRTVLQVPPIAAARRHVRLDNHYVHQLVEHLGRQPAVRQTCRLVPNSSLYLLGNRWRYVQVVNSPSKLQHVLTGVDADEFFDAVIELARKGETFSGLVDLLCELGAGEVSETEAIDYLTELINGGVLIPDIAPPITGGDPLNLRISLPDQCSDIAEKLRQVEVKLNVLNGLPLGIGTNHYENIQESLESLGVPAHMPWLFQVDMHRASPELRCDRRVAERLLRAVETLRAISLPNSFETWRRFKAAFAERYERQEVPLVDALDEETGIPFDRLTSLSAEPAPLLAGLPFPKQDSTPGLWTARDAYLLTRLHSLWTSAGQDAGFDVTEEDIKRLQNSDPAPLPDAFSVMAVLCKRRDGLAEPTLLFKNMLGPSGANLLGRFCHLDVSLTEAVREHIEQEQAARPDAIFAEVVHVPEGRIGNIIARPLLRPYEIPYLGRSGAPTLAQLPISDLTVSVRQDRVVLRSRSQNREVLPRLTTAHNIRGGQAIYRFLCSLQHQSTTSFATWQWGAMDSAPRLPRVVFEDCVLARAKWRLDEQEIRSLTLRKGHEAFKHVRAWRERIGIPRFAFIAEFDNELPVDFENALSVEVFLGLCRGRKLLTMVEMYPSPADLLAEGPEGSYTHEIVVPFAKSKFQNANVMEPLRPSNEAVERRTTSIKRVFPPGSEWIFLKLYAGTASVDHLLLDVVKPALEAFDRETGRSHQWFFLRYGDPEWHLRVRWKITADESGASQTAVARISEQGLKGGSVWRVQLDTYQREVERYGGDVGMEVSESVFYFDSEASCSILCKLRELGAIENRWHACLKSWDAFLTAADLSLEQKRDFVRRRRADFELGGARTKQLHVSLGYRFRRDRKQLESLLRDDVIDLRPVTELLAQRTLKLQPLVRELREFGAPVHSLLSSYLHMSANRLLRAAHKEHEWVIYDYLERLYDSAFARQRKQVGIEQSSLCG